MLNIEFLCSSTNLLFNHQKKAGSLKVIMSLIFPETVGKERKNNVLYSLSDFTWSIFVSMALIKVSKWGNLKPHHLQQQVFLVLIYKQYWAKFVLSESVYVLLQKKILLSQLANSMTQLFELNKHALSWESKVPYAMRVNRPDEEYVLLKRFRSYYKNWSGLTPLGVH